MFSDGTNDQYRVELRSSYPDFSDIHAQEYVDRVRNPTKPYARPDYYAEFAHSRDGYYPERPQLAPAPAQLPPAQLPPAQSPHSCARDQKLLRAIRRATDLLMLNLFVMLVLLFTCVVCARAANCASSIGGFGAGASAARNIGSAIPSVGEPMV